GKASPQLDEARRLTFTSPVTDAQTKDKVLLALFKADKKDAAATAQKTKVEEEWAQKVKANYIKAVELASAAK
ncbi:MAG: ABC transporter substrate-binding protein, partial [Burkholderiales bacterium]|nr:ABC transporter substrate-binding protein [Burkholderiales bacterium]